MAETIQNIPAPPSVASSITDPTACKLYREWEAQDFYPALKLLYPQLTDVTKVSQNVFDMTKFMGNHVVGNTYDLGVTVIGADGIPYTSKQDANASTPPSVVWYKHSGFGQYLDGSVDSLEGIFLKNGLNAVKIKNSEKHQNPPVNPMSVFLTLLTMLQEQRS